MKNKLEIDYFKLTDEDLAQYKKCGRRSLIIRTIFFLMFLPIYIMFVLEAIKLSYSYIYILLATILYLVSFCGSYIIYFVGKPYGIRYGRVSKKTSYSNGKYSGYKYNVYFDDIHKSIINANIHSTKEHYVIMPKDKVKVIKTKMNALYIFVSE